MYRTPAVVITELMLMMLTIAAHAEEPDHSQVPGVVIVHQPKTSRCYIGSPSLAVLPNGDYVASHEYFGPGADFRLRQAREETRWSPPAHSRGRRPLGQPQHVRRLLAQPTLHLSFMSLVAFKAQRLGWSSEQIARHMKEVFLYGAS
jgi:hypothetical protein